MAALTIKESRKLVMPLDTVLEALLHFDGKSHGPLSRGEVLQAELVRDVSQGDGIDVAVRSTGAHIVDWHHFNFSTHRRGHHQLLPFEADSAALLGREIAGSDARRHRLPHREHRQHRAPAGVARRPVRTVAALRARLRTARHLAEHAERNLRLDPGSGCRSFSVAAKDRLVRIDEQPARRRRPGTGPPNK